MCRQPADDQWKNSNSFQLSSKSPPKCRPSYDVCDITELEPEKRGPALHNRLAGEAIIYRRLLDRDELKHKDDGVKYFKRCLLPFFVKGAASVFLHPFQHFMDARRNGHASLDDKIIVLRLSEAMECWMDTYVPLTSATDPQVRDGVLSLLKKNSRQSLEKMC